MIVMLCVHNTHQGVVFQPDSFLKYVAVGFQLYYSSDCFLPKWFILQRACIDGASNTLICIYNFWTNIFPKFTYILIFLVSAQAHRSAAIHQKSENFFTCGCIPNSVSKGLIIMPPPTPNMPPKRPAMNAIPGNIVNARDLVNDSPSSCITTLAMSPMILKLTLRNGWILLPL